MEKFDSFLEGNYRLIIYFLLGVILIGLGVVVYKNSGFSQGGEIEILNSSDKNNSESEIVVEIAGAVEKPGVYKLENGSRIEDLLISAGGLNQNADRVWFEKYINRAAKLTDGQKIYIYQMDELTANQNGGIKVYQQNFDDNSNVLGQSDQSLININSATLSELDKLPGIGQVYGQKIIDQRIYSTKEELLSREVIPKATYEKIKDLITVY